MLAVTRLGIISGRQLAKNRGYVILGLSIVAAVATPTPDPVTMLIAMAPLVVLFELSVLMARIFERRADRAAATRRRRSPTTTTRTTTSTSSRGRLRTPTATGPYPRPHMLFDLRGRGRRRMVQVIYVTLALLMGGGLVLFGIGGNTSGGLVDAINGGGSGSTSADKVYKQRLKVYVQRAKANPNDAANWSNLTRLHFQQANTGDNFNARRGPTPRRASPSCATPPRRGSATWPSRATSPTPTSRASWPRPTGRPG